MATQEDVDTALTELKTEVAADFKAVNDLVAELQLQLENQQSPSEALSEVVGKIQATTAEIHEKYAPKTEVPPTE